MQARLTPGCAANARGENETITPEVFRGFFYGRRLLVGKPSKLQGHCLLTEGPTGIMLTLSLVLAHQIGESQAACSTYPALHSIVMALPGPSGFSPDHSS